MSEALSEPLKRYWFYEMIDDQDFRELLIVDDIAHVLQSCGYPKSLAVSKAFNVFYNLGLWRII
jgi:hypothetical protein